MKSKKVCQCCSCEDKTKDEKIVKVYFCPICQSTVVGYVFGIKNLLGIIPRMQCKVCKFSAGIFPQWAVEQKELNKLNSKAHKGSALMSRKCK